MRRKPGSNPASPMGASPNLLEVQQQVQQGKDKLASDVPRYIRKAADVEYELLEGNRCIIHNGQYAHQTLGEIMGSKEGKGYLATIFSLVPGELQRAITQAFKNG